MDQPPARPSSGNIAEAQRYDVLVKRVIGLFALLCIFLAWRGGYWYDEVMTVLDTALPFGQMLERRAGWGHLPLYFSMSWGWSRLGGQSELWMRLPSILFAVGALGLLYDLAKQAAGARAGFLAVVFAAVNPVLSIWAPQARMYTLLMCLGLLLFWLLLPRGRAWVIQRVGEGGYLATLFVVTVLLAMTHYASLLVLLALFAWVLCKQKSGKWRILMVMLLGTLMLLPWWGYASSQWESGRTLGWQSLHDAQTLVGIVSVFDLVNLRAWSYGSYPYLLVGAMPGFLLAGWFVWQRQIKRSQWLIVLCLPIALAWALAWAIHLGIAGVDRYFLFTLGILSIVWALAIVSIEVDNKKPDQATTHTNKRASICAAIVGVMVLMGSVGNVWAHWQPAFFSFKTLFNALAVEASEDEGILILLPGYELRSLDYYFPDHADEQNIVVWHIEHPTWQKVILEEDRLHARLMSDKAGWWVFLMGVFHQSPDEIAIVQRLLAMGYENVETRHIHNGGMLIYLTPDH